MGSCIFASIVLKLRNTDIIIGCKVLTPIPSRMHMLAKCLHAGTWRRIPEGTSVALREGLHSIPAVILVRQSDYHFYSYAFFSPKNVPATNAINNTPPSPVSQLQNRTSSRATYLCFCSATMRTILIFSMIQASSGDPRSAKHKHRNVVLRC